MKLVYVHILSTELLVKIYSTVIYSLEYSKFPLTFTLSLRIIMLYSFNHHLFLLSMFSTIVIYLHLYFFPYNLFDLSISVERI